MTEVSRRPGPPARKCLLFQVQRLNRLSFSHTLNLLNPICKLYK